jgi:outer membrane biosynthesis protein TonB
MKTLKENLNSREYGAPEMKKSYLKNFRRGLELAIAVHITIISSYLLINYMNNLNADDKKKPVFDIKYINVELDAPPPVDNRKIEIPKTEDIVKPVKDLTALEPIPVSKENAEEMTIKTQDQLNEIQTQVSHDGDSVTYVANNGDNGVNITDNTIRIDNTKKPPDEDIIYKSFEVEKIPECVNFAMVKSSIEYPPLAIEIGKEGIVTVQVLVDTDGKVIKTGSMTGPEIFYEEVKEKAMGLEFTVGLQNGKPVKVWMTVPFSFKLKN